MTKILFLLTILNNDFRSRDILDQSINEHIWSLLNNRSQPRMNRAHSGSSSLSSSNPRRSSSGTIESSVTRLLVSTKHLLESLTRWTRQEVDDKFVSDAYVKLGNDFRAAIRAFSNARVDVSDIGDVPKALRIVLESALSEPPTQESLDRFLPNIRSIIVNLLQNLKLKQIRARGLDDDFNTRPGTKERSRALGDILSDNLGDILSTLETNNIAQEAKSSIELDHGDCPLSDQAPSLKSEITTAGGFTKDALKQLQESKAILRRASKRFSAYQFAKLTNASKPNLPSLHKELSSQTFEKQPNLGEIAKGEGTSSNQITAYLLIADKTKKVRLDMPVTLASLRLCFVEKFAYSPGSTIFPDIYVKNSSSRSYELEEHMLNSEVVDGVSLFLKENIETNDESLEVKFENFTKDIKLLLVHMKEEFSTLRGNLTNNAQSSQSSRLLTSTVPISESSKLTKDLEMIFRDFKTIKQVQNSHQKDIQGIVSASYLLIGRLKESSMMQPLTSNRQYMENSYAKLSKDSDSLLTRVDDLLDMMEALRRDVAQRGVRIGEKQIKNAANEIELAKNSLYGLRSYIVGERPAWKKIWEKELDKVCEEQQFLTLQDDLTQDLEEDIKKIDETFDLIMRCSSQQGRMLMNKRTEIASRINILESGESLHGLKDAILSEVASLVPNHSDRLEAIARAERIRDKERQMMSPDQFEEELDTFVAESRLKKSGGIEELEKKRRVKDTENLKSCFGII